MMAQQARPAARQQDSTAVALRLLPPPNYHGTAQSWRVLCETIWPAAKSAESIMLAVSYCAARHLDPFKRPVHIVPVYNSSLRREVETVWPGINELLTTAARSKAFAGVDEPEWGPEETHTFKGTDREGQPVSTTVTFREWCSVKVWRQVGGERRSFSQPVYWMEAYGRQAFRSELPNNMWEKRPRGQLHKCALAASLRLGFPEDVNEYAAEEMEGREIEAGGVTIEHRVDHEESTPTDRDRQADQVYPPSPPGDATPGRALLEEQNASRWIKNVQTLLAGVATEAAFHEIASHARVRKALEKAPALIRQNINDWLREAHERVVEPKVPIGDDPPPPSDDDWPDDPIRELLAEIEAMNADELDTLTVSASWKVKTRDLFPPDMDRINEAIALRKAVLKGGTTQ
jgi:phage recombination protein Bet